MPPLRRAAVIGAGSWGTALAVALARAGPRGRARLPHARSRRERSRADRENDRYLPGDRLPDAVRIARAGALDLAESDLVCLAVPARDLPVAWARSATASARRGVLVVLEGPRPAARRRCRPPTSPSARGRRAVACLGGPGARRRRARSRRLARPRLRRSRGPGAAAPPVRRSPASTSRRTTDVIGVELAGVAKNAAVLAAAAAAVGGPNAAGAAAGKVFAEVDAYAGPLGARPETFAGLAGRRRPRRHRRRRRRPQPPRRRAARPRRAPREIRPALGQAPRRSTRSRCSPTALRAGRHPRARDDGLAEVVAGEGSATALADEVTEPRRTWARGPSDEDGGRLACVDKAELDAEFSELYRRTCATSTPTRTTGSATTTTPRTSPSRPSCRPTGTSSARCASPTAGRCGRG